MASSHKGPSISQKLANPSTVVVTDTLTATTPPKVVVSSNISALFTESTDAKEQLSLASRVAKRLVEETTRNNIGSKARISLLVNVSFDDATLNCISKNLKREKANRLARTSTDPVEISYDLFAGLTVKPKQPTTLQNEAAHGKLANEVAEALAYEASKDSSYALSMLSLILSNSYNDMVLNGILEEIERERRKYFEM